MSEMAAAMLEVQLDRAPQFKELRGERWQQYRNGLASWEARGLIRLPEIPEDCEPNWSTFFLLLPDSGVRDECIRWMRGRHITAAFHYVPLHSSPMGRQLGAAVLPRTEALASRLLRLPLYPELTSEDADRVIAALDAFLGKLG